jgi:hypothetical protein
VVEGGAVRLGGAVDADAVGAGAVGVGVVVGPVDASSSPPTGPHPASTMTSAAATTGPLTDVVTPQGSQRSGHDGGHPGGFPSGTVAVVVAD